MTRPNEGDPPAVSTRRPVRVRVTADDAGSGRGRVATRGIALPGAPAREADAVFARGLQRTQLRLALGCLAGFLIVAGALAAVLAIVPELDGPLVFGVPLSWLVHAYGFYPIILFFGIVYTRGASRNERRFRALQPGADEEGER